MAKQRYVARSLWPVETPYYALPTTYHVLPPPGLCEQRIGKLHLVSRRSLGGNAVFSPALPDRAYSQKAFVEAARRCDGLKDRRVCVIGRHPLHEPQKMLKLEYHGGYG